MFPVPFPEQNDNLGAGGMPGVVNLPIHRDGYQIISCWQLTPEEMLEVASTGRVYLAVMASVTQPPVMIHGNYPFQKTEN